MINSNRVALSTAISLSVLYLVSVAIVAFLPESVWRFVTYSPLVNVSQYVSGSNVVAVTAMAVVMGLVSVFVISYIAGFLFGHVYNMLQKHQ